ncbi:phosphate system positive regulatory protein pho81 [Coemansia sp. S155-1]|nr:phosphate system positive regulatory protein pho81 [Coemansia sp. S155-1]
MKFGKHIQAQTIPEWAAHYMSYKGLKKIINELSVPLTPGVNQSEASQRRLQTVKAAFFFQVDRELEKVNLFYLQKEADTKVRLKSLIEKQRSLRVRGPRNRTATIRALREAFLNSRHDLDKLQNFVEINNTGFRKILKKWDKRSKSSTKELYLARQVDVQPCFNQDVIAEFSDTVTKCLSELEHALEEETEHMAPTKMPSQLDLISSPSMHSALRPQNTDRQAASAFKGTRSALSQGPNSPFSLGMDGDGDDDDKATPDNQLPPSTRCSSTGFLVDSGLSGSIQIDRSEAELFQALQTEAVQPALDLLKTFMDQRTALQKTSATRVLWRACSELKSPDKQQMLLDTGLADLRSADDINERTLAHEAAIHGSLAILRAAVKAGCDADEPDYYARRPIHYAAINGHEQCIAYLLEQGCSVGIIDDDGRHAFDYAVINGHSECARLLLQYDRTIAIGTPDQPALQLACEKGHQDIVLMLLDAGAEIVANSQGVHPAHVAARAGYADILRLLLAHSQSVDIADKDLGWTPVFYAASEGDLECIRILLDAGCDLDVVDENGHTPAYFAANEGHLDCVDMLLEAASARSKAVLERAQFFGATSTPTAEATVVPRASTDALSGGLPASLDRQLLASEGDVSAMMDLDLDSIPSLSLPPPLIPFRVYGHNFLGKRTRIQIRMHSHRHSGGPPIAFFDNRDMLSLKLVAIAKPDAGMVPHTVMLPLESPNTTFGFLTDDPRNFRLEFFLYPSFGLQPIGKAAALPSLFASASSGVARLPLLDRYLKLVAEISFEFLVIRPFEGAQLQIGGKVETYWKSTNPGPRQNAIAAVASAIAGFSEQSPRSQLTAGLSNTPLSSAIIGSPLSTTDSGGNNQGYAGVPLVVSSSLAAEHICIQVQVCRDGVPVVCPRMLVNVGSPSGVKLCISGLTHVEFQLVMRTPSIAQAPGGDSDSSASPVGTKPDATSGTASEWFRYIQDAGFTLKEVLDILPVRLGLSIQVLYSSRAWGGRGSLGSATPDVNEYIDAIFKAVYEDSQKNARASSASHGAQAGGSILERITSDIYRKESSQRNTIFCSYSPQVCIALNWKQPNYAVFLLTTGREPLASEQQSPVAGADLSDVRDVRAGDAPSFNPPSHHLSLKEAVRFACTNNLLGVMCTSSLLTRVPALIKNIKDNGLFLVSFGRENQDEQMRTLQRSHGVDATMCDGVIKYEADDNTEFAI